MKRFALLVLLSAVSGAIILSLISFILEWRFMHCECKIPENKHIVVIGPSTTTYSLNDEIITDLYNLSQNGAAHYAIYPTLKRVIETNHQIDTLWINHGRFQIFRMTDDVGVSLLQYMRTMLYFMLSNDNAEVKSYFIKQPMFYAAILTPDLLNLTRNDIRSYGFRYQKTDKSVLSEYKKSLFDIQNKGVEIHGGHNPSKEWIYNNSLLTHTMVDEILILCKEHKIVPVLFNTPLYQYEHWCSTDCYKEYLKDMDQSILIADYENFTFPDDSYWNDIIHLNTKGATYLSEEIAKKGLKIQTIEDWAKERSFEN